VILDEPVIVTALRGMTYSVSQQIQRPVAKQHHASHVGSWAKAFVGFYRPDGESLRELDPIARFLYAARSVILVISLQAALIAGLLALTDRHAAGDWALDFILLVVGLVVAHAISNLSNDYFGYRRGHDTAESPRMRYTLHPVASGALTPGQLATGIGILAAVGVAIAVYFCVERGPGAVGFVLAGALLLWLYDAAPITLKGVGLGEIASFLVWGPLMVGGGYYVLAGHVSGAVFVHSVWPRRHVDPARKAHRSTSIRHQCRTEHPSGRARRRSGPAPRHCGGGRDVCRHRRRRGLRVD
jgi:hypothetical protein